MNNEKKIKHKTRIYAYKNESGNKIYVDIEVDLLVKKKRTHWIAWCEELRSFGSSDKGESEAIKDFDRAMEIFFVLHINNGSLGKALKNFGWETTVEDASTLLTPEEKEVVEMLEKGYVIRCHSVVPVAVGFCIEKKGYDGDIVSKGTIDSLIEKGIITNEYKLTK